MSEPEQQQQQQQQGRALPEWANHYEARKRQDPNESAYQEYDDMELWDDDEDNVAPAPSVDLPPVQDYLAMIQQTKKDIEQAQQRQREQQGSKEKQQTQRSSLAGSSSKSGRGGKGTPGQTGQSSATTATSASAGQKRGGQDAPLDLAEVKIVEKEKKPRKPVPRLDAERLLSEQGLPLLRKYGRTFKIRRTYTNEAEKRANAKDNLARMMAMCQTWGDNLFPKATFHDFIRMTESKCKNDDRIKVTMSAWRDEHFENERKKREALAEQKEREAQLAAAAAAENDEMDLESIFPTVENGSSSSAALSNNNNDKGKAVAMSPLKPSAPRTPSETADVSSRSIEKTRAPIELDDDDDSEGGQNSYINSSSNRLASNDYEQDAEESSEEDVASVLDRVRRLRAARLAKKRETEEVSLSTSGPGEKDKTNHGDSYEEAATQPLNHDDDDDVGLLPESLEKIEKMDERPDNFVSEEATVPRAQSEEPEEAVAVSSQRRRRRLIVDESDDE
ncbi:chromosome segregation in meiosis- protein [Actinomortierella wolfii]|nr:chromosome segregation in meiosis- protein [Actinomortierella wolfii]